MHNLWRIRGYLRPYSWQYVWVILAGLRRHRAWRSRFPLIAQRVVDGPVAHRDPAGLWLIGVLALAFGVAEALLNFYRRWVQSGSALGMETTLRNDLYAHLQRLPVELPRRLAVGAAAVAGDHRPQRDPPVPVVRADLPDHQLRHVHRPCSALLLYLYWPLGLVVAISAAPAVLDQPDASPALQRDGPADAGPAGRPGHARGGVGRRHPGHQGVRPARAHGRAVRRAGHDGCTTPASGKTRHGRDGLAAVRPRADAHARHRRRRRRDRRVAGPHHARRRWSRSSRCSSC